MPSDKRINEIAQRVASAVEQKKSGEQGDHPPCSAKEVSDTIQQVTRNNARIRDIASQTCYTPMKVLKAAAVLAGQAQTLRGEVDRFEVKPTP